MEECQKISTYKHRNYILRLQLLADSQKQWKMAGLQEGNIVKNIFSFEGYRVWSKEQFQPSSIIKWRINIFISEEHCNHPLLHVQCIWQIFLFQEYCYFRAVFTAIDFDLTVSISGGHFWFLFRILCFFETSTGTHPFFQRNWVICHTSSSYPFIERPLFYYKTAIVAIYSFSNLPCFPEWKFRHRGIIVFNLTL